MVTQVASNPTFLGSIPNICIMSNKIKKDIIKYLQAEINYGYENDHTPIEVINAIETILDTIVSGNTVHATIKLNRELDNIKQKNKKNKGNEDSNFVQP